MDAAAIHASFEREQGLRLEAARFSVAANDAARARLELQRSGVAARAAGSDLETFFTAVRDAWQAHAALRQIEAEDELQRGWLEVANAFARREDVLAVWEAERHEKSPTAPLERYRRAVAARAAGIDQLKSDQKQSDQKQSDWPQSKQPDSEQRSSSQPVLDQPVPSQTLPVTANPGTAMTKITPPPQVRFEAAVRVETPPEGESVRVSVAKLDALLSLSGELTVTQIRLSDRQRELRELSKNLQVERRGWQRPGRLHQQPGDARAILERFEARTKAALEQLGTLEKQFAQDNAQLRTLSQQFEDEVLEARLLPAALLLPPLERLVRDLSKQLGKRARLYASGTDTEMDRKIVDGIRDPLMHMIRNSLDHGLELPEVRAAHGKPEEGRINLEVSSNGGTVVLSLRDDGAGVNREAVLRRALERGLISDLGGVHPDAALELIFEPGFSTAAQVTETSGRGVGMDVVRENVRQLGGTVSLSSQLGAGTSFTLRVPAQLATTRVLLMRLSDQTVAIPTVHVERTGRVLAEEIVSVSGHQVVSLDGQTVPLAELGDLLDAPFDRLETWQPYAVIRTQDALLACAVDALLDEREVVVKRLGYPLNLLAHVSGAAVLGGGTLVPILSAQAVMERYQQGRTTLRRPTTPVAVASPKRRRVLVVDDSLTSRTLERSILEAAGFETLVAVDGAEALTVLRRADSRVDLVLSDVEMPELDGFGLTEAIRRDPQLSQIPVVLVTSLNAAEHRERGAASGADAYIVKGEFEQTVLLETINGLL